MSESRQYGFAALNTSTNSDTVFHGVLPTHWLWNGNGWAWSCACGRHGGQPKFTERQTRRSYAAHRGRCPNRGVD